MLDYDAGWRDANYHIGRRRTESQRAGKNQSNKSFHNHRSFSPRSCCEL
jgi:hypothetical protein